MEPIEFIKYEKLHRSNLKKISKKIYQKIIDLDVSICVTGEPVDVENLGSLKFQRIGHGFDYGGLYTSAWFHVTGKIPDNLAVENAVVRIDIGGEGLYFKDGKPIQGISNVVSYIDYVQPSQGKSVIDIGKLNGGEVVDMYFDGGYNGWFNNLIGRGKFDYANVCAVRADILDYYYDYLTLTYLKLSSKDEDRKNQLDTLLKQSFSLLRKFTQKDVEQAKSVLSDQFEGGEFDFVFSAVGHAHLDLAWLWPVRETRRKSARTFANQLTNSDKYPFFVFGASQPEQFEYIKNRFPAQYAQIKQKMLEGKFEPQGAMWVECDTNLCSGEALIRQIYYGKKFFLEEFEKDMKICWLPDVFGYNGNLPQILLKCGIPFFSTIKLSWNEQNRFPHRTFNWQGIDGSTVLVHMPPDDTYNSGGSPKCVSHAYENLPEKHVLNEALMVFGIGDGGAGPGQAHIEMLKRQQNIKHAPRIKFEAAIDFFERLNQKRHLLKTHCGELYLEKHQGTYTTQARSKRFNRKIEYALADLEALCAFAMTKGITCDQDFFDQLWKEFLLYQFHDILPGSSITRVYTESLQRYQVIFDEILQKRGEILEKLAVNGDEKQVFNPSPYQFDGFVKSGEKLYKATAKPYSSGKMTEVFEQFELKFGENFLENDKLHVIFDKSGEISSLIDKQTGQEYCKTFLNRLNLYDDPKLYYNAWDIKIDYMKKAPKRLEIVGFENYIDGATVVRKNFYRHAKTTITQEVKLTFGSDVVVFDTICDFFETHKMLRAEFEPSVFSDTVKCDIQLGCIDRTTKDFSSIEKAQFEICAHKFVDLTEGQRGIALLNDCKYGHRVKSGLVSLNLLRSPVFPDKTADRCRHEFVYALFPHAKPFDSEVVKHAYQLNKPVFEVAAEIPPLFEVDGGAIIETIKPSYDGKAIVLRLFEPVGQNAKCTVKAHFDCKKAQFVNPIEQEIELENQNQRTQSDVIIQTNAVIESFASQGQQKQEEIGKNHTIELEFSAFEIKTLKFFV